MSQDNDMPMLQRPAFFPGQRLTADDLVNAVKEVLQVV